MKNFVNLYVNLYTNANFSDSITPRHERIKREEIITIMGCSECGIAG